jgi:7-keto-8-aminopelargonate synthetase-like enzyme
LSFTTGYAATLGTIGALLEKDDILIVDKLVHACVIDAARLCGARLRVFKHNDLEDLADILKWADAQTTGGKRPRVLVVTESVFSMDGDVAPLKELVELKERHGAWLMVDEAHATGLFGSRRSGLAEAAGVSGRIEIQMGTLGKSLGSSGGYIAGSRNLIDLLVNKARSFIFSTAPVPAAAAAAEAAIDLVSGREGAQLNARLWSNLASLSGYLPEQPKPTSAIVPILIGGEQAALDSAQQLRDSGFFIPAIRYPTVARGKARLRVTVSAAHTEAEVVTLGQALLAGKVGA